MPIPISALISSRDSHICPEVSAKGIYGPRDDKILVMFAICKVMGFMNT
jgi:hypothetical protein